MLPGKEEPSLLFSPPVLCPHMPWFLLLLFQASLKSCYSATTGFQGQLLPCLELTRGAVVTKTCASNLQRVVFPCRQFCTLHEQWAMSREGRLLEHLQKEGNARQNVLPGPPSEAWKYDCYEEVGASFQRPGRLGGCNLSWPMTTVHRLV